MKRRNDAHYVDTQLEWCHIALSCNAETWEDASHQLWMCDKRIGHVGEHVALGINARGYTVYVRWTDAETKRRPTG